MKKTIKIGEKYYNMASSAYTQFAYKDLTGRSLLTDLQKVIDLQSEKEAKLDSLDTITDLLLHVAFVMINEASTDQVKDYVSFVKSIENLYTDYDWITETLELACNPISGRLQTNKK